MEYARLVPQRPQRLLLRPSEDSQKVSNVSSLVALGLNIPVAGSHGPAIETASGLAELMASERAMQGVETIDIGVQIQDGMIEPVALRQSLQRSITIMGRWTPSWQLLEDLAKYRGRSLISGTLILQRMARQLQPPRRVRGSGGRGIL